MPTVISVENLSKAYQLGQIGTGTLTNDLKIWWAKQRGQPNPLLRIGESDDGNREGETLWALRDVSFAVEQGEVLGIIGRNGAGKSTLLKILSRITAPTRGKVKVKGRVASLLEVGTGFHPDLTGRENTYLNGAILGMSRKEIDRKFDEIVEFSGVERFIDTPAKRYSSGMYVRLAFAVAAHLEPEILLVDEVLAVGDAEFQKRCLGKMGQVAQQGRTIVFVSHNMGAIQNLCGRAILLSKGEACFSAGAAETIARYLQDIEFGDASAGLEGRTDRTGNGFVRFTAVEIRDASGNSLKRVTSGEDVDFRFHYKARKALGNADVHVSFVVKDQGYPLTNINSNDVGQSRLAIFKRGYFECRWPRFSLTARTYDCSLFCAINGQIADWIDSAFQIRVEDGDFFRAGQAVQPQSRFLVPHAWRSESVTS